MLIKRENARSKECRQQLAKCGGEPHLALSVWQNFHAKKQLREADRSEIQSLGDLLIQPCLHATMTVGLHGLRDDVGIENDHSKEAARGALSSRVI